MIKHEVRCSEEPDGCTPPVRIPCRYALAKQRVKENASPRL